MRPDVCTLVTVTDVTFRLERPLAHYWVPRQINGPDQEPTRSDQERPEGAAPTIGPGAARRSVERPLGSSGAERPDQERPRCGPDQERPRFQERPRCQPDAPSSAARPGGAQEDQERPQEREAAPMLECIGAAIASDVLATLPYLCP